MTLSFLTLVSVPPQLHSRTDLSHEIISRSRAEEPGNEANKSYVWLVYYTHTFTRLWCPAVLQGTTTSPAGVPGDAAAL